MVDSRVSKIRRKHETELETGKQQNRKQGSVWIWIKIFPRNRLSLASPCFLPETIFGQNTNEINVKKFLNAVLRRKRVKQE